MSVMALLAEIRLPNASATLKSYSGQSFQTVNCARQIKLGFMNAYLDNAATAAIRPEALKEFSSHLQMVGNPSAIHSAGQAIRRALEEARESIAASLNADRNEVIFTSGGTEADNLAIKGLYWQRYKENANRTVIVSAETEHHAVIDPIEWLVKEQGAEVAWVPVDDRGVLDIDWLKQYVNENHERIALISLMWVNNEIGVISPMEDIVAIASTRQIPVHSDAIAALGHVPIDFGASGLAAMSISAHKVGGPVGVGALLVSRSATLVSLQHGGGQERGFRSGTMAAAAAKAFARALELTVAELDAETERLLELRDLTIAGVYAAAPDAVFTRADAPGVPNNVHFTFPGCHGDSLLFLLDQAGVQVSTGSACQAGVSGASHVVLALGRSEADASGPLRISFGPDTTRADVELFLRALPSAYQAAKKAGLPT
jgi:cysteine desulfurase